MSAMTSTREDECKDRHEHGCMRRVQSLPLEVFTRGSIRTSSRLRSPPPKWRWQIYRTVKPERADMPPRRQPALYLECWCWCRVQPMQGRPVFFRPRLRLRCCMCIWQDWQDSTIVRYYYPNYSEHNLHYRAPGFKKGLAFDILGSTMLP